MSEEEIILEDMPGAVVKVGGVCYEFVEETFEVPTSEYDEVFEDCVTCQSSSSAGSEESESRTSSESDVLIIPISSSGVIESEISSSQSLPSSAVIPPVLLLHMDGVDESTTFTDSAKSKVVVPHGNVQIDTSFYKAGGASGLFDGSSDYLTFGSSDPDFMFEGDFTVDCWIRIGEAFPISMALIGISWTEFKIAIEGGGTSLRVFTNGSSNAGTVALLANTWYHIAVVRIGSTITAYLNGNIVCTRLDGATVNAAKAPVAIGTYGYTGGGQYYLGWIDEFRIVNGYGAWSGPFVPPTPPYAD